MPIHAIDIPEVLKQQVADAAIASGNELIHFSSIDQLLQESVAAMTGCILLTGGDNANLDISIVRQLGERFFGLPIVMISNANSATDVVALMKANVFSVVTFPLDEGLLTDTLQRASRSNEQSFLSGDLRRQASTRLKSITQKEADVLDLVISGLKNKEIAEKLSITTRAVEHRRFRLMEKLEAKSVAELIATAITARYQDEYDRQVQALENGSVPVRQLVKGIEIWTPERAGTPERLGTPERSGDTISMTQSVYCHAPGFRNATASVRMHRGEGLPGQVWQTGKPVFMNDISHDGFVRVSPAESVGITAGIGLPVFLAGEIESVIVLLLDCGHENQVAIERWSFDPVSEHLRLSDGIFVRSDRLQGLSQFVHLPLGVGLAGRAAEQRQPRLLGDPALEHNIVRGTAIASEGFSSGAVLPLCNSDQQVDDVLVLFNSSQTPLFRLLQIWKPSVIDGVPRLSSEYFDGVASLAAPMSNVFCESGSIVKRAWASRNAEVAGVDFQGTLVPTTLSNTPLSFAVAVPILLEDRVIAVVVMASV